VKYPLEGLLAIRAFREEAALRQVGAAEAALKAAALETEKRRREFESYRRWRTEETERRYQSIMGREMSLGDLDEFKASLASLDLEELLKQQAVLEAEKSEEAARAELLKARAALTLAVRAKRKILSHRDQWLEGVSREEERLQDLELEEFKPILFE
jgi:hypothetical protein